MGSIMSWTLVMIKVIGFEEMSRIDGVGKWTFARFIDSV